MNTLIEKYSNTDFFSGSHFSVFEHSSRDDNFFYFYFFILYLLLTSTKSSEVARWGRWQSSEVAKLEVPGFIQELRTQGES